MSCELSQGEWLGDAVIMWAAILHTGVIIYRKELTVAEGFFHEQMRSMNSWQCSRAVLGAICVPAHGRRSGTRWSFSSLPTQTILWFHDYLDLLSGNQENQLLADNNFLNPHNYRKKAFSGQGEKDLFTFADSTIQVQIWALLSRHQWEESISDALSPLAWLGGSSGGRSVFCWCWESYCPSQLKFWVE